jgi:hypothetical protein
MSTIDGWRCMMALISEIGELEYESRVLVIDESEGDRLRRDEREVRMLEKERDWKRVVRMLTVGWGEVRVVKKYI